MTVHKIKAGVPLPVQDIARVLSDAGFQAYLVGGCVRDLLLGREPKDWDIATDARPEKVQELFKESVYENQFGTVGVKTDSDDPRARIVEVTTFRKEGRYTDQRHPDTITFAKTIEEDLARRDFTVNAIAIALQGAGRGAQSAPEIVDPYGGHEDLKTQLIRAVGEPDERFREDALRLLRAVRLASELGFSIEPKTRAAVEKNAGLLEAISKERIRDEFMKLLMSERAASGVFLLEDVGLLSHVLPELREGLGVTQNKHHTYAVFEHNVRALDYAVKKNYSLEVRMASLLHDSGKPKTKRGEGDDATFYGHEIVGAKMAVRALDRLRFPKEFIEKVAHLVRYHMFYYNVGDVSEAGVRRFLRRVGVEYVDDLIKLREADRVGSNVPKAHPYKLRHLLYMIDKVRHDPLSPKMLKLRGDDVMRLLDIPPGPKVGWILSALLEEILENPSLNSEEHLTARIRELAGLPEKKLKALSEDAKETKEEFESEADEKMKQKHRVT